MADLKENGCALLSSTASVDLNNASDTYCYEVPAGKKCVVHYVVIRNLSADADACIVDLGQSGTMDDFLSTQAIGTNLDGAGKAGILMPIPHATTVGIVEYTAGEIFVIDVTTLAGGACTCTVDVYGSLADA
ncbi:MAG: hypothetical protein GY841_04545 [FCB group bacterium]|nr:hypothetical protein [FCB group bacterium]